MPVLSLLLSLPSWLGGASDPTSVAGCCIDRNPLPWSGYNRAVVWTDDLAEASRRAKAEGKFVMVFRLVGDLRRGGT